MLDKILGVANKVLDPVVALVGKVPVVGELAVANSTVSKVVIVAVVLLILFIVF